MIAPNIESTIKKILNDKGKGGWLRTSKCAELYASGDKSKETKFYRWRKKIEKGNVKGFQVVKLPNNISYIGLDSADPNILKKKVESKDKTKEKIQKSKEKKNLTPGEMAIRHFKWRGTPEGGDNRYFKHMFDEE